MIDLRFTIIIDSIKKEPNNKIDPIQKFSRNLYESVKGEMIFLSNNYFYNKKFRNCTLYARFDSDFYVIIQGVARLFDVTDT